MITSFPRQQFVALGWCAYFYAKMIFAFAGASTVLLVGLYTLLIHYFETIDEMSVWLFAAYSLGSFYDAIVRVRRTIESDFDVDDSSINPFGLDEIVEQLCAARKLRIPKRIVVLQPPSEETSHAMLYDALFGQPLLILNGVSLAVLSLSERRAVLAHELRHLGSFSSTMQWTLAALKHIVLNLWNLCGAYYLFIEIMRLLPGALARDPLSLSRGVNIWETAVVGYFVYIVHKRLFEVFESILSRADEHRTDILSCIDTADHVSLIHALERMDQMVESDGEDISLPTKFADLTRSDEVIPSSARYILGTIWLVMTSRVYRKLYWSELTKSHPTTRQRRRALERIFGPAPPLGGRWDHDGPLRFVVEIRE